MKLVIDNHITDKLSCGEAVPEINDFQTIIFKWPTLLKFLKLDPMPQLKTWDETNPIFQLYLKSLFSITEKELLYHIYDMLFAETIGEIKSLKDLSKKNLLEKIENISNQNKNIINALQSFQSDFSGSNSKAMHDLILYLSFERMCHCLSKFLDYQTKDLTYTHNLKVLRECLIDSYVHIRSQGNCFLSFYTLIESLFFFEMREENLSKHTDEEWKVLNQTFSVLKQDEGLTSCFYIDDALSELETSKNTSPKSYLSCESKEIVEIRLNFANVMLKKLQNEIPSFQYVLKPLLIIYSKSI